MYAVLGGIYGALLSVMNLFNAQLSAVYCNWGSTVLIHAVGLLVLLPLAFTWGRPKGHAPWYLYGGGLIGIVTVTCCNLAIGGIGVTANLVIMLLGQLTCSTLIDQFGLFGARQVKLSAAAAKEEAEVLYRAGRPVLRWAGAERAMALWMQGTAQTLTFRREDGSFAVKRPMCTIAAEDGELVFQLEGRLEEPKKTSVLSQAQTEQWLQTVAEEVLEQTQAAGADWFCIQGQLRQRTGNEKGRTRVQVRLVAD